MLPTEPRRLLLAIDLINAFGPPGLSPTPELPVGEIDDAFCARANRLLRWAEASGALTAFICDAHTPEDWARLHEPPHALEGTPAAELMAWVYRPPGAPTFSKHSYSALTNPAFVAYLHANVPLASQIVVIGTSTGVCVRHTVEGLLAQGYRDITVVSDAVADIFPGRHAFFLPRFQAHPGIAVRPTDWVIEQMSSPPV